MTLEDFADKLKELKILIVGDVMIDSYMWGSVTRISPEAPVPVVAIDHREQRLGGAANVALNIESLGATPYICSVLGNDDAGKTFLNIMYQHEMDKRGILNSDDRITTVKSRVIGNNMHLVRVDEETTRPLTALDEEELITRAERIVKMMHIDAIIFQDYDKGCITPRVIDAVTAMARRKHIITTVDPKHRNFKHYHDVTLFKPNLKELKEGMNIEIDDGDPQAMQMDLDKAAIMLHEQQRIEAVFITLSDKGIYACDFRGKEPTSILLPAHLRTISDVSGAGDTVISVATVALAAGMGLNDVLRYANMAGGIVCEQVGVVPIDRDRLLRELEAIPQK